MKLQSNVISLIIIAGMIIALVGAAYVWAVPLIEKRATVTDYEIVERFMLDLDQEIVKIANTGSGVSTIDIPRGVLTLQPHDISSPVKNTLTLDFYVSQPIITEGGSLPVRTGVIDYIGEYGKSEPRILMLNRHSDADSVHLNMTMFYREMRSNVPKGYVIALCPITDFISCESPITGGSSIRLSYGETIVEPRIAEDGGDLTMTKVKVEIL